MYTIDLRQAYRQPGCPICRLHSRMDRRYLYNLLYENVNDGGTRVSLVRAMGLCPEHAWQLQAIEQENWHDGLGVGIIYEDLVGRVSRALVDYLEAHPPQRAMRLSRLRERLMRSGSVAQWIGRRVLPAAPARALIDRLSPQAECRACELVGGLADIHLGWLVESLAEPEMRALYAASDGLCLPHLRGALAKSADEETARCLVEVATSRLAPLLADLGEYVRKHDWNNRQEPKLPWEEASWIRAVAVFSREPPEGREEEVYQLRLGALADYGARSRIS